MKLNCIITDDEPIAREIIGDYIKMLPDLNVVAQCQDAIETFNALREHDTDVLFLDIQMPEINGVELIRSLKKAPQIIFTTAYPTFAVDGYDLDAVDYLLKPVSLERFLRAIDKLYARLAVNKTLPLRVSPEFEKKYFFIKSDSGLARIDYESILYIEGLENYVKLVCENKTVISLNTMKSMEALLPAAHFLRIHRSYIVNMNKVENVQDYCFKIKDKKLITGKSYRKNIQEILRHQHSI